MIRTEITTPKAPAVGPQFALSQGVRIGNLLQTSGQVAQHPQTGQIIPGGFAAQMQQALRNVVAVLEAGGATLHDVLMMRVYVTDPANLAEMNEIYSSFVGDVKPARTTICVGLPGDYLVEIEALAIIGSGNPST